MKTAKHNYFDTNEKGEIKKQTNKGLMYISSPREIASIIKSIPKGKVITTKEIIAKLTAKHKVDFTCPLTTGIFVSVIAKYVEEEGIKDVPYWRVVKDKGVLYDKYLGMLSMQPEYLKSEGWKIERRGKQMTPAVSVK